jgi:predicted nuclease with TOPRIM domain
LKVAQSYLDLGTDPSLDLAVELRNTKCDLEDARQSLASSQKQCSELLGEVERLKSELAASKEQHKVLRLERNQANTKLEELLRSNPSAAYDLYRKGAGSGR